MQQFEQQPRLTPWVLRLLAVNAVVLLLQETLITSPRVTEWLSFDPGTAFRRPWTFFSYQFLHGGLLHLAANSLGLFIFGPSVEQRLGSSRFILYYLYCGLGGAVLSLLLATVMPIGPFIGASGAVLGLAVAFARFNPDATLVLFPIPVPIKAKSLVWIFAALAVVGAISGGNDGIAHIAHLGGLGFGLLYFAALGLSRDRELPEVLPMEPRVPVGAGRHRRRAAAERQVEPEPKQAARDAATDESRETDRLLDKISATGIESLSSDERAFLKRISERRRSDLH
ncbi:MAG TPA: rhomboid family intramembrane serine protease [Gemmatimonadales bacterium]|nr:rhomboid family intramembrane serine protease [Gemmatimonadales bacterium]